MHLLGVELAAERRVAGEVGEEHRDLPPLALGLRRGRPVWRRRGRGQRRDRVEQLAAVADRHHAEFLQVVGRQPGQDFGVDLVVAERLFVLPQAEPAQPGPDLHLRPSARVRSPPRAHSIPIRAVPTDRRAGCCRGGGCLGPVRFSDDRRQGGAGRVRRRSTDLGRGRAAAGGIERRLGPAARPRLTPSIMRLKSKFMAVVSSRAVGPLGSPGREASQALDLGGIGHDQPNGPPLEGYGRRARSRPRRSQR